MRRWFRWDEFTDKEQPEDRLLGPSVSGWAIPRPSSRSSPPLHQPRPILKVKRLFEKENPSNGKCAPRGLSQQRGSPQNCGNNLGTKPPENRVKSCSMTEEKAKRANKIAFLRLFCNQGVRGSSPLRSTKLPCHEGGALGAPAGGEQKAKQDGAVPGRPAFSPDRTLPHDSAL